MNFIKFVRIFLLVLIIIGIGLIATQKMWVPKLVDKILAIESNSSSEADIKLYSPSSKYYAIQKYIKSEMVTCCGNDEPQEKKFYSVSIFESGTNKLIKEFTEFNTVEGYEGYTPEINKWYADDILQMSGSGIIDAFNAFYNIPEDKLLPEWEFHTDMGVEPTVPDSVINALKKKDMQTLSQYIHPAKGVRFSSSAYVSKEDVVFKREEILNFFADKNIYTWGSYDGTGDPINLTPTEYYEKYIYNADYVNAPKISQDPIGQGNTINNAKEFYDDEYTYIYIFEYHFPGFNPEYGGMDWTSLRLVFEDGQNDLYLIGIIKDNWTI